MEKLSTRVKASLRIRERETPRGYPWQEAWSPEREREFQIEIAIAIAEAIEEAADRTVPSAKECLSAPGQEERWLHGKYSRISSYPLTSCQ